MLLAALLGMSILSGCGDDSSSAASSSTTPAPTAPPTNVVWTSFAGVKVPCAEEGPRNNRYQAVPTGYARTGAGAALAAISATIRMSVADDNTWPNVVGTLVAPSAARDQWSINRVQLSITQPVPKGKAPRVIGYTVESYTPDRATVAIVTRQSDDSLTRTTADVKWMVSGDWLLELPAVDSTTNRVQALDAPPANMIRLPETN
ncbi:hypothetical protein M0655_23375 (plasmid) [Gordonia amicalis]|uniref:hypothetical protein n=1 Tax=Gordonia amicalis TaxID=89053 RepID=UPI00200AB015|nr:hypothetical protein [Gordonia amicalis]UPW16445.1 hypothetical protein M0655_23375 [Gordonia amicalis]